MKINNKRDDFSHSKQIKLHIGCCCCCCCLFWPGGIIGGILGNLSTKNEVSTFKEYPDKKEALSIARKWFWFSFLGFTLITGLLFVYGMAANNSQIFVMVSVIGAPALQILASALISSSALKSEVPDNAVRKVLIKRNFSIAIGSILGYGIGWATMIIIINII